MLAKLPPARDFVTDAYAHYKYVAYTAEAAPLLQKAGVERDNGFSELGGLKDAQAFIQACVSSASGTGVTQPKH